ncbi:MAG: ferredoxin [Clostridium sp.]|nr:ferredoxin [Clostridium sp.]
MKAIVDQDTCIGCGACVGTCPDVYSFNDNGKAEAISGDIPADFQDDAKDGRDQCPVNAIDIKE